MLFVSFTHAGVSIQIDHPRYPSLETDNYTVKCAKNCAVEVRSRNPREGSVIAKKIQPIIKELMGLELPKKTSSQKVLYKVEAEDGKKKLQFELGYPKSYEGEEYKKYSRVVGLIEDLKRAIVSEIPETK